MGGLALLCALLGAGAVAVAGVGKFAAVALGLFAAVAGLSAWRRPGARARGRLLGAAAVAVGAGALAAGAAKVGLTLLALERLGGLLS